MRMDSKFNGTDEPTTVTTSDGEFRIEVNHKDSVDLVILSTGEIRRFYHHMYKGSETMRDAKMLRRVCNEIIKIEKAREEAELSEQVPLDRLIRDIEFCEKYGTTPEAIKRQILSSMDYTELQNHFYDQTLRRNRESKDDSRG